MGLFKKKQKVTTEEFCKKWYDEGIFNPMLGLKENFMQTYCEQALKSLIEVDKAFLSINKDAFIFEMTAMRIELFSLAWGHLVKKDEFIMAQAIFTKNYLINNNKHEIYLTLFEYNESVAKSTTVDNNLNKKSDLQNALSNKARMDRFSKLAKKWNLSPESKTKEDTNLFECIGRIVNRIGVEEIKNIYSPVVIFLSMRLAMRLGLPADIQTDAIGSLNAIIFGFYQGAKESIQEITLK